MRLGVNIDHIATLRNARGGSDPCVLKAARTVEEAGARGLTFHLREDRRHIKDEDVHNFKKNIKLPLNFEMALSPQIIKIALDVVPSSVCIVPEKRKEVTTEGGLDAVKNFKKLSVWIKKFKTKNIKVSLFIEPIRSQIKAAAECGADFIEIHTGKYALSKGAARKKELEKIKKAAIFASKLGLRVNAGHGLDYENVKAITAVKEIEELNIGHSIIARAVFTGLKTAVEDMIKIINSGKKVNKKRRNK